MKMAPRRSTKTDSPQLVLFGGEAVDEDAVTRERVLDGTCSFLVQAPAGSGKTGLLIQRFLALLARVERPEAIIAMTFTRKAAAEMRERIVGALRDAAEEKIGDDAYERRTLELAKAALAQDSRHGWKLSEHPARLQIQTIDALCAGLVRQAPLASRFGAMPRMEEQAASLHRAAAANTLAAAMAGDRDWRRLLFHLDNDADATIAQLAAMLAKREQWMRVLLVNDPVALRGRLEQALEEEIRGELSTLARAFPLGLVEPLVTCAAYAARHHPRAEKGALVADALEAFAAAGGLPPATVEAFPIWRGLAEWLLLAGKAEFRASVNSRNGFPAKGNGPGAVERQAKKDGMEALLSVLAGESGLAESLALVRRLPPGRYDDETWALIESLARILKSCAAELLVTFAAAGTVDFPQAMLAALDALGDTDAPTELLLKLDYRIEHLLIDEFQDTSLSQFELIRRLTEGWEPGDGRTVFAVGDPMQSIYRFRQAEVRLFVEAQQHRRIAEVAVECCTLRRNFRSRPAIVDWVNETFPEILGNRSDPWRSAVEYKGAAPTRAAEAGPAVIREMFSDPCDEATAVVAQVRAARERGAREIAILVRARPQLKLILPALREAGLSYAAVELDALSQRPAVLDLLSLTHALAQPADRLAWLAVLRAPWCGLQLPDLFALTSFADAEARSIADAMIAPAVIAALSDDGRLRLARVAPSLAAAIAARGRASLCARARGTWLALGGPACVEEALDLDAAEQYFALLARHERAGEIPDWTAFIAALDELRATPVGEDGAQSPLTVMTLHRAKGLEFDTVILPGLGRPTKQDDTALLRWRRRPDGILLAPMRSRGGEKDPVYEYLSRLERDEEDAELGRLLYVGCTRARERLHLIAAHELSDKTGVAQWGKPPAGSALAKLWPVMQSLPVPRAKGVPAAAPAPPRLRRLPSSWVAAPAQPSIPFAPRGSSRGEETAPAFDWAHESARCMGIVGHRMLMQVAKEGIEAWTEERIAGLPQRLAAELGAGGLDGGDIDAACVQIQSALSSTIGDARGKWLLDSRHRDARSEYALSTMLENEVVNVVLDRSFVDGDGTRWVVDFKFSRHEGKDRDAFLDSERERYREQLERYARVMRRIDAAPIRLGLYFPLLGGWREWPAPD
jgi:ATP-dependent exoDNAse (exonuclease V) beta subunit